MFEWFLYISLALGFWLIYEMVADRIRGPGRYWVTLNVEGDAERVEYLIKQLAKDQKIKIRSQKIEKEKPEQAKSKLENVFDALKKKVKRKKNKNESEGSI